MKHTWSLDLSQHKRKLTWLDDELGRWIAKLFDFHRPNRRRWWRLGDKPSIAPTKFITGNEGERWSSLPRWKPSLNNRTPRMNAIFGMISLSLFGSLKLFLEFRVAYLWFIAWNLCRKIRGNEFVFISCMNRSTWSKFIR